MGPFRTEIDTIGPIDVAEDRLWGAQTQRALQNFADRLPTDAARNHSRAGAG